MKKIGLCVLLSCMTLLASAQSENDKPAYPWSVSLQGGGAYNLYENAFSYWDNGKAWDLLKPQMTLGLTYDFTRFWGVRLQTSFGTDAGGCNVQQTSGGNFYPYTFKHFNLFSDLVFDLVGGLQGPVRYHAKMYMGAGFGHTFGFTDAGHPWQNVNAPNTAFGFRGGLIMEYRVTPRLGIYMDLCGEAYTDGYNGLKPSETEQQNYQGYAGFPLDLRGLLSLGVAWYF